MQKPSIQPDQQSILTSSFTEPATSSAPFSQVRTTPSCLSCRQAKRKCDHERPICSRCGERKLHCEYPTLPFTRNQNACSGCRGLKSQCDGDRPCGTCRRRNTLCQPVDSSVKATKASLPPLTGFAETVDGSSRPQTPPQAARVSATATPAHSFADMDSRVTEAGLALTPPAAFLRPRSRMLPPVMDPASSRSESAGRSQAVLSIWDTVLAAESVRQQRPRSSAQSPSEVSYGSLQRNSRDSDDHLTRNE